MKRMCGHWLRIQFHSMWGLADPETHMISRTWLSIATSNKKGVMGKGIFFCLLDQIRWVYSDNLLKQWSENDYGDNKRVFSVGQLFWVCIVQCVAIDLIYLKKLFVKFGCPCWVGNLLIMFHDTQSCYGSLWKLIVFLSHITETNEKLQLDPDLWCSS